MLRSNIKHLLSLWVLMFIFSLNTWAQIRILPLGNSITIDQPGLAPFIAYDGHDGQNFSDNPNIETSVSYRKALYDALNGAGYQFDFIGHYEAGTNLLADDENCGIPGSLASQLATLLHTGYDPKYDHQWTSPNGTPYFDAYTPDLVLLHIGTNDISFGTPDIPADILSILYQINNWASANDTMIAVVLAQIIQRQLNDVDNQATIALNDEIAGLVGSLSLSNIRVRLANMENALDYQNDMFDNVHPNQTGYDKMGQVWFNAIEDFNLVAPNVQDIPDQSFGPIQTNVTIDLSGFGSDPQETSERLSWSLADPSVHFDVNISTSHVATITPKSNLVDATESLSFVLHDYSRGGEQFTAQDAVSISYIAPNYVPVITAPLTIDIQEDESFIIALNDLTVTDLDNVYPDDFTLILLNGDNYSFSGNTIIPDADFNGHFTLGVKVNDGLQDSPEFFIQVNVQAVNDAPRITSSPVLAVQDGNEYHYQVSAEDVDLDVLSVSTVAPLPSWMSLDTETWLLTGTPVFEDVGSHDVSLGVSDGQLLTEHAFTVEVAPADQYAPVITAPITWDIQEDEVFSINLDDLTVTDHDNAYPDDFSLRLQPGESYSLIGNEVTPAADFNGSFNLGVIVNDGILDSPEFFIQVNVQAVNDAPRITSSPVLTVQDGNEYLYQVSAEDVDLDVLSINAQATLPAWMILDTETWQLTGTPAFEDVGSHDVSLGVSDGQLLTEHTFTVEVTIADQYAPVITAPLTMDIQEDEVFSINLDDLTVTDHDNAYPDDFSLRLQPGENYSLQGNEVTPDADFNGSFNLGVIVNDGVLDSPEFFIQVNVQAVNDAPRITSSPVLAVQDGNEYRYQVSAEDVDLDVLSIDAQATLPSWMILDSESWLLTGTPAFEDVGSHDVSLGVSDGQLLTEHSFTIEVAPADQYAPVITAPITWDIQEDEVFSINLDDLTVTDHDNAYPDDFSLRLQPGESYSLIGNEVTPAADFNGSFNLGVIVNDGGLDSPEFLMQVNVLAVNDAPRITSSPVLTVQDGDVYSYRIYAEDVETDDLELSILSSLPSWLQLNPDTWILSGRPSFEDVGSHQVQLGVGDGEVVTEHSFSIEVSPADQYAPEITAPLTIEIDEDESFIIQLDDLTVIDHDNTYPDDFSLHLQTGENYSLEGNRIVPAPDFSGYFYLGVIVNDGALDSPLFLIQVEVEAENDAPLVTSSPLLTVQDGEEYRYQINATDAESNPMTIRAQSSLPAWLTLDEETWLLSGTPEVTDVGNHNINIGISDGDATTNHSFVIEVQWADNHAPEFITVTPGTATEEQEFRYALHGRDIDGDPLTMEATQMPAWLSFDGNNNTVFGTPDDAHVGEHGVSFSLSDGTVRVDTTYVIVVAGVNDAPQITSTAIVSFNEDTPYQYHVQASDPDGPMLIYELVEGPEWLNIHPNSGMLSGTPPEDDDSEYQIQVQVNDGAEGSDLQSFLLDILPINDRPVIISKQAKSVNEDESILLSLGDLEVTDVDNAWPNDFTLEVLLGRNYTFEGNQITPSRNFNGRLVAYFSLSDGAATISDTIHVEVNPVNDAPEFTSPELTSVVEGQPYRYQITGVDAEDDPISLAALGGLPSWLRLDTDTWILTGTPQFEDVGNYLIRLQMTDGQLSSEQVFTITVEPLPNHAPQFTALPSGNLLEDEEFRFQLQGSDFDNDAFTIIAVEIPDWFYFNTRTFVLSASPDQEQVGEHLLRFYITDGSLTSDTSFTLEVINVNDVPQVLSDPIESLDEDVPYAYQLIVEDPDGPGIVFNLENTYGWLSIDEQGLISGLPLRNDTASYELSVTVDDLGGGITVQTFTLDIQNINDPPEILRRNRLSPIEDQTFPLQLSDLDVVDVDHEVPGDIEMQILEGVNYTFESNLITPLENYNGLINIRFELSDGVDAILDSIPVEVAAVNDLPIVLSEPLETAMENQLYSYQIEAFDVEGELMSISTLDPLPKWLSLDEDTWVLSGTPQVHDGGTVIIRLGISDGVGTSTHEFDIAVNLLSNHAPFFTALPNNDATEDADYSFTVLFDDHDEDPLSVTAIQLPSWLNFEASTGLLSGQPSNEDVGEHTIQLSIYDGKVRVDTVISLIVINVNDDPVITSDPVELVQENRNYLYQIEAFDPDSESLTYYLVETHGWLSIDRTTGLLTGNPPDNPEDSYDIAIFVQDDLGASAIQNFVLRVIPYNDAPIIESIAELSTQEDVAFELEFSHLQVQDSDNQYPGDFSIQILPGEYYLAVDNEIVPPEDYYGNLTFNFELSDGTNTVSHTSTLWVAPVNDAPRITKYPDLKATEGEYFTTTMETIDVEGDPIFIEAVGSWPTWLQAKFAGAQATFVAEELDDAAVGLTPIKLKLSDGDAEFEYSFEIEVSNVNDRPVILGQKEVPVSYPDSSMVIDINNLSIADPDNSLDEMLIVILEGSGYVPQDNGIVINSDAAIGQELTVSIQVSDSDSISSPFAYKVLIEEALWSPFSESLDFKLYPNPSRGLVTFVLEESSEINVRLYSLSGILLLEQDLNAYLGYHKLDFRKQNSGVYLLQLRVDNRIAWAKLVLNNYE